MAVFHGGTSAILFKQPVEIGEVVKTRFEADLIDRLIGIEQQFAGMADPDIYEKLGKTPKGILLKKMAER